MTTSTELKAAQDKHVELLEGLARANRLGDTDMAKSFRELARKAKAVVNDLEKKVNYPHDLYACDHCGHTLPALPTADMTGASCTKCARFQGELLKVERN